MSRRVNLMIAAALTTFVLVVAGGLVRSVVFSPQPEATLSMPTAEPTAMPAIMPTSGPAIAATREAAYQEQIRLANERLQQANQLLQQADERAQTQPTAPVQVSQPAPPAYAISADQAARLALGLAPGLALSRAPELVSYQGTPAYEVVLDAGTLYIDANSGEVLYNGISAPTVAGSIYGGEAAEYEREHDEYEHERGEYGHEYEHEHEQREGHDD